MQYPGYYFNFSTTTNKCVRCGMYPPCPDGQSPQTYHESVRNQMGLTDTYVVTGTEPLGGQVSGSNSIPYVNRFPESLNCSVQPTGYTYTSDGKCTPVGFSWFFSGTCNMTAQYTTGLDQVTNHGTVYNGDLFEISDGKLVLFYAKTSGITISAPAAWNSTLSIVTVENPFNTTQYRTTIQSDFPGRYIINVNGGGNSNNTFTIVFGPNSVFNTSQTDETSRQFNKLLQVLRNQGLVGNIVSV